MTNNLDKDTLYQTVRAELYTEFEKAHLESDEAASEIDIQNAFMLVEAGLEDAYTPLLNNPEVQKNGLEVNTNNIKTLASSLVARKVDTPYQLGIEAIHKLIDIDLAQSTDTHIDLHTTARKPYEAAKSTTSDLINNPPIDIANSELKANIFEAEKDIALSHVDEFKELIEQHRDILNEEQYHATLSRMENITAKADKNPVKAQEEILGIMDSLQERIAEKLEKIEADNAIAARDEITDLEFEEVIIEETPKTIVVDEEHVTEAGTSATDLPAEAKAAALDAAKNIAPKSAENDPSAKAENTSEKKLGFRDAKVAVVSSVVASLGGISMLRNSSKTEQDLDPMTNQVMETKKPKWFKRILGVAVIAAAAITAHGASQGKGVQQTWTDLINSRRNNKAQDTNISPNL